jgi:hypothetical protein
MKNQISEQFSDFRKDNKELIEGVFEQTVAIAGLVHFPNLRWRF